MQQVPPMKTEPALPMPRWQDLRERSLARQILQVFRQHELAPSGRTRLRVADIYKQILINTGGPVNYESMFANLSNLLAAGFLRRPARGSYELSRVANLHALPVICFATAASTTPFEAYGSEIQLTRQELERFAAVAAGVPVALGFELTSIVGTIARAWIEGDQLRVAVRITHTHLLTQGMPMFVAAEGMRTARSPDSPWQLRGFGLVTSPLDPALTPVTFF